MYLKRFFKIFSTMTCCFILLFSSFRSFAYENVSTTEIEYLDDGTYFEITIEEVPSIARASTITGKKTAKQKSANGTVVCKDTCPRKFLTTISGTPASSICVAVVCLMECGV